MPGANHSRASKRGRASDGQKPDGVERVIYAVVLAVVAAVPLLAFAFSFGNVGLLGVSLGVNPRIAYLTGPAVDLSVVGLIVAGSYLSHRGRSDRDLWPVHTMSLACGAAMIALNCGQAVYEQEWRLAAFDAVGPLLLIGWGFVGPWLLRQIADARRLAPAAPAPESAPTRPGAPRPEAEKPTAPAAPRPLPDASDAPSSTATAARPAAPTPAPARANIHPAPATPPAKARMTTPTDRDRKIRDLILEHGRDGVDGRMVADALGIHRSNGRLALKKFLEALDAGEIPLGETPDPSRAAVPA